MGRWSKDEVVHDIEGNGVLHQLFTKLIEAITKTSSGNSQIETKLDRILAILETDPKTVAALTSRLRTVREELDKAAKSQTK